MSEIYSHPKFGIIVRKTFGLTKKCGGETAAGFTWNETEANAVTRWYPKGPIKLLKVGALVLSTIGKGEESFAFFKNTTRSATLVCSTTAAQYTIASKTVAVSMAAGDYLNILASTNVCSTGTVALFVDYRRTYDDKWDPSS
jgi:hypothetical protein